MGLVSEHIKYNTHFQIIKNIKKNIKQVFKIIKEKVKSTNFLKIHKELRNPNSPV